MATVSQPKARRFDLQTANRQVRDPLHKLRAYIRRYVVIQAFTSLLICLAAWFWISLILDYASFQLLTFDWVQDLPRGFRAFMTGGAIFLVWFFVEIRKIIGRHPVKKGHRSLSDELVANKPLLWGLTACAAVIWLTAFIVATWIVTNGFAVGVTIGVVLAAFTAIIVFARFRYEFSDTSLALLLERRFPKSLGDRLITAVELSNPREAAKFGYSQEMIEETIAEAAERVGKLPVGDVFDWKRLYKQGIWAALLTVGLLLLSPLAIGGLETSGKAIEGKGVSYNPNYASVVDTSEIWFERNILLQNTIWPRRCLLEIIDFPDSGEMKIGRGDPPPAIRVKAMKWVIADGEAPEGWRQLRWQDLKAKSELLGGQLPAVEVDGWTAKGAWDDITIDQIELNLDKQETHKTLKADEQQALRELLTKLEERCGLPEMKRRMRMLLIPETVSVKFWGKDDDGYFNLTKQRDNEYAGQFPDLKSDVKFVVKAEDYFSGTRRISVVPPPSFENVVREELHPAYLYYYGDPAWLKGQKQAMPPVDFNARNVSVITVNIPTGSSVVITAETNKELREIAAGGLTIKPKEGTTVDPGVVGEVKFGPKKRSDGFRTVVMTFNDVKKKVELTVRMVDTDGVVGTKEVVIEPTDDTTPEIEVKPEIIRTVNNMFMVTPGAIIPFAGRIIDYNGGLDELADDKTGDRNKPRGLEYVYQIMPVESPREEQMRAARVAGMLALPMCPNMEIATLGYYDLLPSLIVRKTKGIDGRQGVSKFQRQLEERRAVFTKDQILGRLNDRTPLTENQKPIVQFPLDLDDFVRDRALPVTSIGKGGIYGFDVEGVAEEAGEGRPKVKLWAEENEVQQRYRMQLWVEAVDNNIETGRDPITKRNRGVSKQKYTFMVVSEAELLVEIGREEQRLFDDFKRVVDELIKLRNLMGTTISDLALTKDVNDNYFNSKLLEVSELEDILDKQLNVTNKVADDYERILNEMRVNRIKTQGIINNVETKLVSPLDFIRKFHWVATKEGFVGYHKTLDDSAGKTPAVRAEESRKKAEEAQLRLQGLIDACNDVLNNMQGVKTFNELIKLLRNMEEKEQQSLEAIGKAKKELLKKLEEDLNNPKK